MANVGTLQQNESPNAIQRLSTIRRFLRDVWRWRALKGEKGNVGRLSLNACTGCIYDQNLQHTHTNIYIYVCVRVCKIKINMQMFGFVSLELCKIVQCRV